MVLVSVICLAGVPSGRPHIDNVPSHRTLTTCHRKFEYYEAIPWCGLPSGQCDTSSQQQWLLQSLHLTVYWLPSSFKSSLRRHRPGHHACSSDDPAIASTRLVQNWCLLRAVRSLPTLHVKSCRGECGNHAASRQQIAPPLDVNTTKWDLRFCASFSPPLPYSLLHVNTSSRVEPPRRIFSSATTENHICSTGHTHSVA